MFTKLNYAQNIYIVVARERRRVCSDQESRGGGKGRNGAEEKMKIANDTKVGTEKWQ